MGLGGLGGGRGWGGACKKKIIKSQNNTRHFHDNSRKIETIVFFNVLFCLLMFTKKIQGLHLENQDPSRKEEQVSEDGDEKKGFETILR